MKVYLYGVLYEVLCENVEVHDGCGQRGGGKHREYGVKKHDVDHTGEDDYNYNDDGGHYDVVYTVYSLLSLIQLLEKR